MNDLRELAHGVHPQILSEGGVFARSRPPQGVAPPPVKRNASDEQLPEPVAVAFRVRKPIRW
jgi:hypothetical protein